MVSVPVSFNYNNKQLTGMLQAVSGGGAGVWHLMIDNYYYGRLRTANGIWVLDTNKKSAGMGVLAPVLGQAISEVSPNEPWDNRFIDHMTGNNPDFN